MQMSFKHFILKNMEKSIVSRLQGLLKSSGIDEMELAKRINKHPSTIYRMMKGENSPAVLNKHYILRGKNRIKNEIERLKGTTILTPALN